jgi:WS/DGAT/MGAT family acyltransferase
MLELLSGAVVNTVNQYTKMLWTIPEMARTAFGLLPSIGNSGNGPLRLLTGRGVFAPKTSFNVSITNQRSFAGRTVPLAEVKEIGKRLGASVNDVMMATVSGALRRFLQGRQELPDRSLTAAVPVSLRQAGDTTANNQVSVMLVSLATNLDDPAQRLRHIKESSDSAKATLGQIKAILPTDLPVLGAPWLISGLASLYGRARVADLLPPVANLIISNVPGVPVPLYFAGARLASYYPVSLPAHGMALNVTVQSYNGRLDYGLIGCRRALPDLNGFGDLLLNEHRDLLILAREPNAGVTAQEPAPISIVKTGTGGTS